MLCKALKDFKANTEVNVPIFLKLTSDLEQMVLKIFYLQSLKPLMV